MFSVQLRWPAPSCAGFLRVMATVPPADGRFSSRVRVQISGGKLLANAPYALIDFVDDPGCARLDVIFPAAQLRNVIAELNKLQLLHTPARIVDDHTSIERCLRYSVVWRLCPAWNRVGHWLIMGDTFLDSSDYHYFVEFTLSVCAEIVFTITNAATIRLRPLTLEALFPEIRSGEAAQRDELNQRLSAGHRVMCRAFPCFVLPWLKKASVVAVTRTLIGVVDTPEEMSSYWTGRYGYRLDNQLSTEANFYCEVAFPDGSLFVYPRCCVKLDRGRVVYRPHSPRTVDNLQENLNRIISGITADDETISSLISAAAKQWFVS